VAIIPTKRLRNKIAGFTTHVMKRIQRGPVRGISLKLQEEERERRMDFVPDQSAINTEVIEVDRDSMEMLRALNCAQLPGLVLQTPQTSACRRACAPALLSRRSRQLRQPRQQGPAAALDAALLTHGWLCNHTAVRANAWRDGGRQE